jgi:FkbM family methyltransferase
MSKKDKTINPYFKRCINGNQMILHYNDQGLSRELFVKGRREQLATRKMQQLLKTGDVVYDIGANIGYFALLESTIIGDEGHVFAVEPVPFNVDLLRQNIKINRRYNITVYDQAIGSFNGKSKISLSDEMNKCTMSDLKESDNQIEIKVQTADMFSRGKDKPTMLRMDVEGYEYEILKGAEKLLASKNLTDVFLELHPSLMHDNDVEELLHLMRDKGFRIESMFRSDKDLFESGMRFHRFATFLNYDAMTIDRLMAGKTYKKVGCPQIFFKNVNI